MLTLISEEKRSNLGILDPQAPIIRVSIVLKDGRPEVLMTPGDDGTFTQAIAEAICKGDLPENGTFIYHICFGEQTRIATDDQAMARVLLGRFKTSMMAPIDALTEVLSSLPNRDVLEGFVKAGINKALMAAAACGRTIDPRNIRPVVLCATCGGTHDFQEAEENVKLCVIASNMGHRHPYFRFFSQLVEEATGSLIESSRREVVSEFLVNLAAAKADLEGQVN